MPVNRRLTGKVLITLRVTKSHHAERDEYFAEHARQRKIEEALAVLDIHPASESERIATFRNVHDVWSDGLSLEKHVQRRIESLHHQRAEWFVGCRDGRVVTSLGCYPVEVRLHGRIEPGMAIVAVHTLLEDRGHGFAPELIGWVEEHQRQQGTRISLLFSDIDPGYYERLGYRLCPSWEAKGSVSEIISRITDLQFEVIPVAPLDELPVMKRLYDRFHSSFPLSLARSDDYWDWLIAKDPDDLFFRIDDGSDSPAGYLRLARRDGRVTIRDWAVADHSEQSYRLVVAAAARVAISLEAESIGGWWPDHPVFAELLALRKRETEITMFKPLDPDVNLDDAALNAGGYIRQIDHV